MLFCVHVRLYECIHLRSRAVHACVQPCGSHIRTRSKHCLCHVSCVVVVGRRSIFNVRAAISRTKVITICVSCVVLYGLGNAGLEAAGGGGGGGRAWGKYAAVQGAKEGGGGRGGDSGGSAEARHRRGDPVVLHVRAYTHTYLRAGRQAGRLWLMKTREQYTYTCMRRCEAIMMNGTRVCARMHLCR